LKRSGETDPILPININPNLIYSINIISTASIDHKDTNKRERKQENMKQLSIEKQKMFILS
jgi:hypothetical protein